MDQQNATVRPVAVVTDSAACVPPALVRELGIGVVPFQLIWDGETYEDGRDLPPDEFYRRFRASSTYPTTSTPALGQYVKAYAHAAETAAAVVAICVSGRLTSSYSLAQQAAREAALPVHVVDSTTATSAQAFIVLEAARAARAGATLEQTIAAAESARRRVGLHFAFETLEHLRRGGRLGEAATLLGARLNLQPIMTLGGGVVRPVGVTRTRQRALDRVLDEVRRRVAGRRIRASVFHADVLDEAQQMADRIQREFDCIEFFIAEFTPVMGAHTGPGVIGAAYCIEEPV
jgi:DegV family protein with EDD domain